MLADEQVDFVPYVGPRDWLGLLRCVPFSHLVGDRESTEAVVSTGSGMALAYLPRAAMMGIPTHYIESATRITGPSRTGDILSRVPGVHVHTQYRQWAAGRWHYSGSVFEGFEVVERPTTATPAERIKRVVVSLGTIRGYGFRRLVERLTQILGPELDITWQTGDTDVRGLSIIPEYQLPRHEFVRRIRDADVVVAHAGTGIALTALMQGRRPLLVPREARYGEHVDDHQAQIARLLSETDLAVCRSADELDFEDLELARLKSVVQGEQLSLLSLA